MGAARPQPLVIGLTGAIGAAWPCSPTHDSRGSTGSRSIGASWWWGLRGRLHDLTPTFEDWASQVHGDAPLGVRRTEAGRYGAVAEPT